MATAPVIFLIDNGSLRPEATLELRCLAAKLSNRMGERVLPVSLLHSSKITAMELFGKKAQTVKTSLRKWIEAGERSFVFLPLFLGPSRAIAGYLQELIEEACKLAPGVNVVIAPPLAGENVETPDIRLAEILASHVRETLQGSDLRPARIAVIDHGTPEKKVNQVRNAVANQVRDLLGGDVAAVAGCSMERREGAEYDFNEPLLENLGQLEGWQGSDLIVAMFFLLPGRHAGPDGDVAEICKKLVEDSVFPSIQQTTLIGKHSLLIDILADRLSGALKHSKEIYADIVE
jgi:sirohydrochlorin ferrochelatase